MPSDRERRTSESLKIAIPGLSWEKTRDLAMGTIPEFGTINEAFAVVRKLAETYADPPVVILDEYHKLAAGEEREKVADFVRGVSDQEIPIRFIICGVGETLDEMITRDPSHGRFLKPIALERISIDARQEILTEAAKELGITLDREAVIRIAMISDGYPYYVKLIGEHLFWALLDDNSEPTQTTPDHFDRALLDASEDAEANFKETYEVATRKYKDDYSEILWAFADNSMLERKYDEVYSKSYLPLMDERQAERASVQLGSEHHLGIKRIKKRSGDLV